MRVLLCMCFQLRLVSFACRAPETEGHFSLHSVSKRLRVPPTHAPHSLTLCSSFSLTAAPSGSYGLKLSGKAPAMVAQVQKGSPAARAGLQVGDFVLRVAGQELRSADGERVLRRLKEEVGKTVEVMVARPFPVPVTDKEKMKALIVLQTKVVMHSLSHKLGVTFFCSWTVVPFSNLLVSLSVCVLMYVFTFLCAYMCACFQLNKVTECVLGCMPRARWWVELRAGHVLSIICVISGCV